MLPKEYGGGGISCVDLVTAAEELSVVDPGFACTVLKRLRFDAGRVVGNRRAEGALHRGCDIGPERWPSSPGSDAKGVNAQTVIVQTNSNAGGTSGLSAIIVERGTLGVSYRFIGKEGHRLAANAEGTFETHAYRRLMFCPALLVTAI